MTRPGSRHAVAGVLLAGLLIWAAATLLGTPCVGVADNLDYWRVMRPAGIAHLAPVERPGDFVRCRFETSEARLGSGLSSAAVVAWAAKHLGWGLPEGPGRMDLRQVGVLYLLLAAAVLALGVAAGLPPLLALGFLYVLADPGYLLFFNSFYADSALFTGLLAATVWLARIGPARAGRGERPARAIAAGAVLVLASLLGGASRMQYVLLPATVLGAYLTVVPLRGSEPGRRRRLATLAIATALLLVAVAVPLHFFHGPAPRFPEVNRYHAVYAGLFQVTSRPDRVLEALEIPEEHRDLPRRDVWSGNVPPDHPVHDHLRDLSRLRLLGLYLAEPGAILAAGARIQGSLAALQSHTRGTFVRSEERPRRAQLDVPWRFARLRGLVVGIWPPAIWLIPLAAIAWLLASLARRRWDGRRAAALLLLLFAGTQLPVVVLGDGFVALEQHLVGARLALDLLVVLLAWQAVAAGVARIRERRRAAGAPQPPVVEKEARDDPHPSPHLPLPGPPPGSVWTVPGPP